MMVRFPRPAVLGGLCALGLSVQSLPPPASGARSGTVPVVPVVQGRYLIGCGGCHGVQGRSGQRVVPDLAGQVGYFLCTPEGREYLVRLPNVAFANLSSQDLADMVNFVVFTFGHDSLPAGTKPYTAAEIARLRADPLRMADLHLYRDHVVRGVVRTCPRARALHDYDTAQAGRESGRDAP